MITFNDKLEVTDHDLRQHIESCDLISTLPNTAFAQGFQSALREVKKFLKSNVSGQLPLPEAIEFGNWLGFHYYRVDGWKWRQIRDESDTTEYPMVVLYDKFKREGKR